MGKLKDKLIRKLGGYTEEDIIIRTRPQRVAVSKFSIRTLKVCQSINQDVLTMYPDYINHAEKDMAYQLADKMREERLIEYISKEESPKLITVTAIAKVVAPYE